MTGTINVLKGIGIILLAVAIIGVFCIPGAGNITYAESGSSVVSSGNWYYTVPTVAIKSLATGKYLAADTSDSFSSAALVLKNTSIKKANKFELLQPGKASGGNDVVMKKSAGAGIQSIFDSYTNVEGLYALRSTVTQRIFMGVNLDGKYYFSFGSEYLGNENYLVFLDENGAILTDVPYGRSFYIGWADLDNEKGFYLKSSSKNPANTTFTTKRSNAELFTMELVDDNRYTQEELNILESDEWFNIDDKYVGYWDIQSEIGEGQVYSLRTLGYTIFKRVNQSEDAIVIKTWIGGKPFNMTFGMGVKKVYKGSDWYYDVIITCQGTAGYPTEDDLNAFIDAITNISNGIDGYFHVGYKQGAQCLTDQQYQIYGDVDGNRLSLARLISEARKGNAHFTILGHSMGGAIAQCLAYYLAVDQKIPASNITGRTFEAALVSTKDIPAFTDWINICVNTDGVSNGTVPGSILEKAGIHRLGKTIYLYDPIPQYDVETYKYGPIDSGISPAKHEMDKTPRDLMRQFYGDETDDVIKDGVDGTWITVDDNLESNNGPYASSGPMTQFPEMGTEVDVVGYKVNSYGNRWYLLADGSWMYGGNIQKVTTFPKAGDNFYVRSSSAPIRKAFYQEAKVLKTLSKNDKVTVDMSAINSRGNTWYHVKSGSTSGWIWSDHLVPFNLDLVDNYKKVVICCPVDVDVMADNGTPMVSIHDDEITLNMDETKVVPVVDDDQKTLYLLGEDQYQIKITARDYGELDYYVQKDYDEEAGEYVDTYGFAYVELEPDKVLGTKDSAAEPIENSKLTVIDPETNSTVSEVGYLGEETETESEEFFKYTSIKKATVPAIKDRAYTGKAIKPTVTVKFNGRKLVKGTDYKVTYKSNTKIGKAKVVISGINLFTGSVTKYFNINPAKVTGLKLTSPKSKQLKVKYTKGKGSVKYQIQYKAKGTTKWKKTTATGTSKLIKKLKGGKYYQVRVRAVKTVSGKTYTGAWSAIKTIKVKK